MRRTTARAAALAAALLLSACGDAARPLAPTGARPSLAEAGAGTMIAFVHSEARCGVDGSAGCGYDGGWGWSRWWSIATVYVDGFGQESVTYPVEGGTGNSLDGEARSAAPSWSPDGMRIAYQAFGDVYTADVGAVEGAQLTSHSANDYSPAWSPDGATIAFASDRDGAPELYLMRAADGSDVTRLTTGVGFTGRPDWSPDGTRIAFDCIVESGNMDICAVGADGTGLVRLTSDPGSDNGADWSPSGEIAFATTRYGGWEIAAMAGDGSAVRRVAAGVHASEPDWSPDGTRIAYTGDFGVWAMQADGTAPVLIVGGPDETWGFNTATQPAWRPIDVPRPPVVDQPPQAHIGGMACWPLTCEYYDGSWDDHGIVSRVWTFGDGATLAEGNVVTATHTYAAAGVYEVTLTVTDGAGQTSRFARSVTVFGPPVDQPPIADFTYSCARTKCTLDGRASTDDQGVVSYEWTLGTPRGDTAAGAVITFDYRRGGSYAVTLTVRDAAGQSASLTRTVVVAK